MFVCKTFDKMRFKLLKLKTTIDPMLKVKLSFIFVILTVSFMIQAQDFDIDLHKETNNKCQSCHHQRKIDTTVSNFDKCQNCHNLGESGLQNVSANVEADQSKKAIPSSSTLGMRYPMYYQRTRLSDKPNEMVLIPAGEFIMGTDKRLPDEGPQHKVNLPAFYIDIYEVTNLQYKKFNNATKRRSPTHFRNRTFPQGKADHPVTYVSWDDAHDYCKWAGKRLPTDQEWEKAARGTEGKMFP